MKAAHQGVTPVPLPNSQPAGLFAEHGASFLAGHLVLGADADADVCQRCRRPAGADPNLGAAGSSRWTGRLADGTAVRTVEFACAHSRARPMFTRDRFTD